MIETTIQNPERHETLRADRQGRVNLGIEYAGRNVEIVVVGSGAESPDSTGIQQTIGGGPMGEHGRKGMLFVRSFGIDRRCLADDHTAVTQTDGVNADTVGPSDVNWSHGFISDPKNVARFEFDEEADDEQQLSDLLTAEPAGVTEDGDEYGEPVYCYENEAGEVSAVAREYVENVRRVFGDDPTAELSNVRVHPDDGDHPVMFRDPASEAYIAIAPRLAE